MFELEDDDPVLMLFNEHFDNAKRTIPFSSSMRDEYGYFVPAVTEDGIMPSHEVGERFRIVTDDGKRCIALYTKLGIVIVFELVIDADLETNSKEVHFAYSASDLLEEYMLMNDGLCLIGMTNILGDSQNWDISRRIEHKLEFFNKHKELLTEEQK